MMMMMRRKMMMMMLMVMTAGDGEAVSCVCATWDKTAEGIWPGMF